MILTDWSALESHEHDVCIIGGGPVGISMALELARFGKRVLLFESGGRKPTPETQALSRAYIPDPTIHDEMEIVTSRQLGGTSNLWGARCQPLDPIDFVPRSIASNVAWPITLSDLAPFYTAACRYASCGDPVFRATHPVLDNADIAVDATRTERFSNVPAFQRAHGNALEKDANIRVVLNATLSDVMLAADGGIQAVKVRRLDGTEKAVPARVVVLCAGGLETTRVLLALQSRNPSMFGGPDGPLGRYYMAHVIGEVADISWNDPEVDAAYDFAVDEHGSYRRRRMIPADETIVAHDLPNISFWPVVPPVADARHGSAILSMVFMAFAAGPIGRLLVAEAIRRYHAPMGTPKLPHILNILKNLPSAAAYLPGFFRRRYFDTVRLPGFFIRSPGRTYGLSYHAEHLPSANSRVWLTDERDAIGLPRLGIDLRFSDADAQGILRAHQQIDAWLRRNALGTIRYRQPVEETAAKILAIANHGTHHIGTTRMAANRKAGVVDGDLQVFDIPDLYVASSSVFPTSGQANPTLTAIALGLRLAARLSRS